MGYFIDFAYDTLNKKNEELCGDNIEIIETDDHFIFILADGLGSGVKANILSTMTTKIAGTMLRQGASIEQTMETIASTLPVCNVRKLAYSTFAILKISKEGKAHIVEYDSPPIFFIRDNKYLELNKKERIIQGKKILETEAQLLKGDTLVLISDGAIHAGVGGVLNLGWQWDNVGNYLINQAKIEKCAKVISKKLIDTCFFFYNEQPGDDTSTIVVRIREPEITQIFSGPPKDKKDDVRVVEQFLKGKGKKVVCGGTAANIVSRETKKEIFVDYKSGTAQVPPTARIDGIDLVTEGVITLSKVLEYMEGYLVDTHLKPSPWNSAVKDGALSLMKLLIEDSTHVHFWVGKAINPAHQNPNLPMDMSIKIQIIQKISALLEAMGKIVTIEYY
jgi:hypothetical protein